MADNDPDTPKKVVVVAVVHHISWAMARGGPLKLVGGLMGAVDVIAVAVVHYISWAAVWAGPSNQMGRLIGWAERREALTADQRPCCALNAHPREASIPRGSIEHVTIAKINRC